MLFFLEFILKQFLFCIVFFTRIQIPIRINFDGINLGNCTWVYPLIGALVGGVVAGVFYIGIIVGLHPAAAAWLAIFMQIWLTGGLHEDGLADTADGMAFGRNATQKLDIMRDSRIGSYGVLALIAVIGLRASLIGQLEAIYTNCSIIICAAILSRISIGVLMFTTHRARAEGMASLAGAPSAINLVMSIAIGLGICAFLLPFYVVAAGFFTMIAVSSYVRYIAKQQFNGITGDVLGCNQQISEVFVMIALYCTFTQIVLG